MTVLEKLGIILTAFALKFDILNADRVSVSLLISGSVLILLGDFIEKWLRKTYPNIKW